MTYSGITGNTYSGYSYGYQKTKTGKATDNANGTTACHPTASSRSSLINPRDGLTGFQGHEKIRGSYRKNEELYLEYKLRKPGKSFFTIGKVFKVLWPELLGHSNSSITVTSDNRFGSEAIATKIRWFVVVKEGKGFCSCLSINTYNQQGVAKRGVVKWQHAIAFSSRVAPETPPEEKPGPNEKWSMMPAIPIISRRKGDKLDLKSRIDFARVYTVEHNVKVYDFGEVQDRHKDRLVQQWLRTIKQDLGRDKPSEQPNSKHRSNDTDDELYENEAEGEEEVSDVAEYDDEEDEENDLYDYRE